MSGKAIDLGYRARDVFRPFHARKQRWACLVAHRRCGKTVACVADLVDAALRAPQRNGRYAYIAPYYRQAKDVSWQYVKDMVAPLVAEGLAQINETELRADLWNGARIRLYGADKPDSLRGIYLDGVVLDEYADMSPRMWAEVLRPALADRKGWAVFIGTPKGRNSFYEIFEYARTDPDWLAMMLRVSETKLVDDDELQAARRVMTPEQYDQEFECSFDAAIMGAYFGKELADADRDGRIAEVAHDPALPVHTAWDLGISDTTAIWFFQVTRGEIRVIDYYENHSHGLTHYAAVLGSKPYRYGDDWVPHDAKVRELGTGRTRVETLKELGRKPRLVPDHKVMDGINAARLALPKCWFDAVRCRDGIEALRQYRADYDEKRQVFRDAPLHDWASHPADAFRYMAMAYRELKPPEPPPPKPEFRTPTLNEIWRNQPKRSKRL